MSERKEALKEQLTVARQHLLEALALVGARGDEQLYSEGAGWTLRQLAIHLMVTDRGISRVIQQVAEGQNPITAEYDVDRFNHRAVEKNADVTLEQALAGLRQSRTEFLAWLDAVDEDRLDLMGLHPLQITMPVWQFIETQAIHEQGHADDIQRHLQTH